MQSISQYLELSNMKTAWFVLLISAFTDFIITAATSLTAAMVASGSAELPNRAVIVLSILGGLIAAGRTIQQALKSTPETVTALRGGQATTETTVVTRAVEDVTKTDIAKPDSASKLGDN